MHLGYFLRTRADATFPIPSDSGFHLIHHGVKSVAHTSEKRKQQGEGHHVAAKSTNDKSVHSIQIKSYVGHRMTESFSKPDRNHNHHNLGAVYSLMRIWARSGIEFQRESSWRPGGVWRAARWRRSRSARSEKSWGNSCAWTWDACLHTTAVVLHPHIHSRNGVMPVPAFFYFVVLLTCVRTARRAVPTKIKKNRHNAWELVFDRITRKQTTGLNPEQSRVQATKTTCQWPQWWLTEGHLVKSSKRSTFAFLFDKS